MTRGIDLLMETLSIPQCALLHFADMPLFRQDSRILREQLFAAGF